MNKEQAKKLNESALKLFQNDDPLTRTKNAWGRVWVEAERPIPEKLRSEFYDELVSDDDGYRKDLEESVRWFGVRYYETD